MKGTEKQITWAETIKKTIIDTSNEAYDSFVENPQYDVNNPAHKDMSDIYKSWGVLAEKEDNAAFFINYFSRVESAAPLMQRIKAIRTAMIVNEMPKEWRYK